MTGIDLVNHQRCVALNFGFNGEIPFSHVHLTQQNKNSWGKQRLDQYRKCYFIYVGGKYVQDIKGVIEISEKMVGSEPRIVFLMKKLDTRFLSHITSHKLMKTIVSKTISELGLVRIHVPITTGYS